MPNIIPTEIIYDERPLVTRSQLGLRTWNAIVAGIVPEMHLWVEDAAGLGVFRAYFNIRKNGVPLFTSSQLFEISPFVLYVAKTGLSIPVSIGDEFSLDLQRRSRARVVTPITFLMRTQEI